MSYEAWGDDDEGHENCRTDEHVRESFVTGAQAMREMLARLVEQGGDKSTAASLRANWPPSWGADPGRIVGTLPVPGDDAPMPRSETARPLDQATLVACQRYLHRRAVEIRATVDAPGNDHAKNLHLISRNNAFWDAGTELLSEVRP